MAGRVFQVVERLLCMHEALSSNSSPNREKKNSSLLPYRMASTSLQTALPAVETSPHALSWLPVHIP
jgi:hypothetical protein